METEPSRRSQRRQKSQKKKRTRIIVWSVVGVVVLGLLGAGLWVGTRALIVKDELEAAKPLLSQAAAEAKAFDFVALQTTMETLDAHASAASDAASTPAWVALEWVPWAGANLYAARTVAQSLDAIVADVALPAVTTFNSIDPSSRNAAGTGFDLTPLRDATAILGTAETTFAEVKTNLDRIDREAVISQISGPLKDLDAQIGSIDGMLTGASGLLQFTSAFLGLDGARTQILMFQNNAEATALGGSAASYTIIKADDGAIDVIDQAGSGDLEKGVPVDVPVDPSALEVFGPFLVTHGNTATSRPDFPTAAAITQAHWQRSRGLESDGVVSVDPLALARILQATGPIPLETGDTLTAENAVQLLVNEIYFRYPTQAEIPMTDAFFALAASAVLDTVKSGTFDMKLMLKAVQDSIDTGSIMMYSSHPEEQALLDGLRVQGVLPTDNATSTVVGTFFRDLSVSKVDYYLDTATRTTTDICEAPANPTFTTAVSLHSRLTDEIADSLPPYILSYYGTDSFRTQVFIYGPPGSTVVDAPVGLAENVRVSSDLGRPVVIWEVPLFHGETKDFTATFSGAEGEYGPVEMWTTPMINTTAVAVEPVSCG